MNKNIKEALPGFVGLKEFFRRTGEQFEPIVLNDNQREFYLSKIEELEGFPSDLFFNIKWAWRVDAHLREARKYANGVTMVRFGVGLIACGVGLARDCQNLLMAFDEKDVMLCYTVIAGKGMAEDGIKVYTNRPLYGGLTEHTSFDAAEGAVKSMTNDDFLIIEDVSFPRQYFQVLAGIERGRLVFAVEYCLENFVFHFSMVNHVDADEVIRLIKILKTEGFAGLQDAAEWRQVDVEGYWKRHGKELEVDIGILAHIYRTEVQEGDDAAAELREIFDNAREDGEDPLSIKVAYASEENMRAELFELAKDMNRISDGQRKRIALFIYMMINDAKNVKI